MASLATRDYLMKVEEELEGELDRAERKLARREVRSLIQDMAFRLAARKERPAPEDIDYEMALEALRPPEETARILARKRGEYRRRKWRGRARTAAIVLILVVVGGLAVQAMTSETSEPVFSYTNGSENRTRSSTMTGFVVDEEYRRLDYQVKGIVTSDEGQIRITLLDPANQVAYQEAFTRDSGLYSQGNVPDVPQGNWTLVVDFADASGSVRVDVRGVTTR